MNSVGRRDERMSVETVQYYLADSDGRIVETGCCRRDHVSLQAREGVTAHEGWATHEQYLHRASGELVHRARWAAPEIVTIRADGVDAAIISVPHRARCYVNGPVPVPPWVQDEATGCRITTIVAGRYQLHVDPVEQMPVVIHIHAVVAENH
jgi:hypothetical protein